MSTTLSDKKFLRVIYTQFKSKVIDINSILLLPGIKLFTTYEHSENACYCASTRFDNSFRITFGGYMLSRSLALPERMTMAHAKAMYADANRLYRGVYYHEIGHLKYTDMTCMLIPEYKDKAYVGVLHRLFNTLEDIVIERYCMSLRYPYVKKYFNYVQSLLFNEKTAEKYRDTDDDFAFLNYLLLKLRMGKAFTGTNKFADANPEYLDYTKSVLSEPNGTKRIEKSIIFFEWLISKGLKINIKDVPKEAVRFSKGKKSSEDTPKDGASSASSDCDEKLGKGEAKIKGKSAPKGGEGSGSVTPSEESEESLEDDNLEDELEGNSELDPELSDDDVEASLNDALGSGDYGHEFYTLKNYITPSDDTIRLLDEAYEEVSSMSTEVANQIKTFKSRNKPRYEPGYSTGKLHVPSAISGTPVNIFKRLNKRDLQPDLAIYLLIDNSGSMYGTRAEIATKASLALSLACSKSNIPFAVSCFTSNYDSAGATCYTYRIKTFKDIFQNVKYMLGVTSYRINSSYVGSGKDIRFFAGNIDEINLYHIGEEYKSEPYKDKVLIIISDGETCGNKDNLKELASKLEKDFYIVGIGATTNAPASIYSHSKIFKSLTDLEGLPDYLGEVLLDLSKCNKGGK